GIREIRPRLRVEVDTQLDRVVGGDRERRPGMKDDRVHLSGPDDRARSVQHDLRMLPAAVVGHLNGIYEIRRSLWQVLREKALTADTRPKPLQRDRPATIGIQKRLGDQLEVLGELSLGDTGP